MERALFRGLQHCHEPYPQHTGKDRGRCQQACLYTDGLGCWVSVQSENVVKNSHIDFNINHVAVFVKNVSKVIKE